MPALKELQDLRSAMAVLCEGMDRSMAWRLAGANALALVSGALAGLAPVALKELIDAMSSPAAAPWAWVTGLGITYLLCLCAGRLIAELRPFLIGGVEQRVYAGLRVRYFAHLLSLPLSFHLARQSGALGHSLQQAVLGYQLILSSLVNGLVPVLVEAVTVAIVLLHLGQPALATTFALTGIALSLVVSRHMPRLRTSARAVTLTTVDVQGLMADGLLNYEPIKCFGAEHDTIGRYRQRCQSLEIHWRDLMYRRFAIGTSVTAVFTLSVASSLTLAILAVSQGSLSLGGFVLATLYMVQIIRPLELLSNAARDVSQGLAFARPMLEILDAPANGGGRPPLAPTDGTDSETAKPNAAPEFTEPTPCPSGIAVSFRHVRLSYDGGPPVFQDFSIDLPPGKSLAIVGASGCGKSSLVRLLLRLCEPDSGSITLNGIPIDAMPVARLRSMIAVVPQDLALFNNTIAANIGLGRAGATSTDIENAARLAGLHSFIAALSGGYDTNVGERGLKLSGGERQRIAIARAILKNPLVYVFDEATSMLDGPTERAILQNIKQISTGRTTINIAHRLSAIQHADEIAVLGEGKIVERGTHASLLARGGVYAAMWEQQQTIPSAAFPAGG